jgi:hypothetical protein
MGSVIAGVLQVEPDVPHPSSVVVNVRSRRPLDQRRYEVASPDCVHVKIWLVVAQLVGLMFVGAAMAGVPEVVNVVDDWGPSPDAVLIPRTYQVAVVPE